MTLVLQANKPAQAEFPLHCVKRAASGMSLHVFSGKSEYMCFNQKGDISTLRDDPLKLVDKFTYLGSSASSTMNDINTWLAKKWKANDRLSVILKSDLTDKIKRSLFQAAVVWILLHGYTT